MELEFHQIAMKYESLRITMPARQARLAASLAMEGQLSPVQVVESEGYVLIDGYRRVSALRTLGRDTVEVMVLPLCESAALIHRYSQENAHKSCALEEGWFLRELMDLHGLSQAELSRRLQRSESWISRRLSLVRELPPVAQELVRRGGLCGHAAGKYLVPLARAKRSDCVELVRNLQRRISARELERLYVSWKSSDAEGRRRIVQSPQLFLKTAEELKSEPENKNLLGDDTQRVFDDMEILDAVSGRARRRVRRMKGKVALSLAVVEAWRIAQSSFTALARTMEKQLDAGHGNQNGDLASQS